MIDLFISAFVSLFVVIDPIGCAPIFASMTGGAPPAHRRAMAIRAVVVAGIVLLVFAVAGEALLHVLGIALDSFRIAGGIMLFFIALEMVFEKRTRKREDRAQRIAGTPEVEDVSIFPMALPMIAGPGSIAAVMLLTAKAHGLSESAAVLGAMVCVLVAMLAGLLLAGPLMRMMGEKIEAVLTRVLGVILAALAVQFVVDGVRGSLG